MRTLAGLPPATWTYPDPVSSPSDQRRTIYAADIQELRTNLDAALGALSLPFGGYTDPSLSGQPFNQTIKKHHFNELRQRVK